VDANGDGEISFEEFSNMMKRLSAWSSLECKF
jgi:Ca2+-binding EF-hand superfamily protein